MGQVVPTSGLSALTVEAWFEPTSSTVQPGVIVGAANINPPTSGNTGLSKNASWLYEGTNGEVYGNGFQASGDGITNGVPLVLNQWYQAVLTVTSGTQVLYIDGQEVATSSPSGELLSTTGLTNWAIGSGWINGWLEGPTSSSNFDYFQGDVSQVSVYETALSAAQVQAQYNAG